MSTSPCFAVELVRRHGGSISAEHGIGLIKRGELARYKDPVALARYLHHTILGLRRQQQHAAFVGSFLY